MDEIRATIQRFYEQHPVILPITCILVGVLLLWGCISNWNWLFGNISRSNYSPEKIDGLVNTFGRKAARVMVGFLAVLLVAVGIMSALILCGLG